MRSFRNGGGFRSRDFFLFTYIINTTSIINVYNCIKEAFTHICNCTDDEFSHKKLLNNSSQEPNKTLTNEITLKHKLIFRI